MSHRTSDTLAQPTHPEFDPEPWRAELIGFLKRMGAAGDAEDIVQETFLRSVRQPPTGEIRPWLYGIAMNLLRDQRRAAGTRSRHLERVARDADATPEDPANSAERRDLAEVAWRRVELLPKSQRRALRMRIEQHYDYAAIAAALQCTEATARQHFYLGMKAIRSALPGGDL